MIKSNKTASEQRLFAILFLTISAFALIGSLYTWGSGLLFDQQKSHELLLPIVDLILTFPLSFAAGYLLLKDHRLGFILGLILAGSLLYGSIAVYIELYLMESYSWRLAAPPIAGIALSVVYFNWCYQLYSHDFETSPN